MNIESIAILIGKVLSQNATNSEVESLQQWRNIDEKNESFFIEMKKNWDLGNSVYNKIDLDKAREIVKTRLLQHYSVSRKPKIQIIHILQRVAAILIIPLLIFSAWQFNEGRKNNPVDYRFEQISPKGQVSQCMLPDGSYVWLNGGSSIVYTASDYQKERIVELKGEGYFQVAKNEEVPFLVHASNRLVKVYGTKFNVNGYNKDKVIVTLEEGKVGVAAELDAEPSVFINPGEQVIVKPDGTIKKQMVNDTELFTSWKDRRLVFRNEDLKTIAKKLEDIFDVKISFKDTACQEYRYRGIIEYENSIFHTMEILEMTSDIKYKMTGRNICLELKK